MTCPVCGGSGADPSRLPVKCSYCGGSGTLTRATDRAVVLLDRCTSEMRGALLRLRSGAKFLGPEPPAIPRGTAHALRRRGLIADAGGSQVTLTDLGRQVATLAWRRSLLVMPPGDDEIRMTFIVHARQDTVYAEGCLDSMLATDVQLRKDLGGSYSGRLVGYEVLADGRAVRLTMDVPDDVRAAAGLDDLNSRLSLPATP